MSDEEANPFGTVVEEDDVSAALDVVLEPFGMGEPAARVAVVDLIRRMCAVAYADGVRAGWSGMVDPSVLLGANPHGEAVDGV